MEGFFVGNDDRISGSDFHHPGKVLEMDFAKR